MGHIQDYEIDGVKFAIGYHCDGDICLIFSERHLETLTEKATIQIAGWFSRYWRQLRIIESIRENGYCEYSQDALEIVAYTSTDPIIPEQARQVLKKMTIPNQSPLSKSNKIKEGWGWVYLIRADNGVYKIGRTHNPDRRMGDFSTQLPYKLEIVHLVETDDMIAMESGLHELFKAKRLNGEWFQLESKDVEFIKQLGGEGQRNGQSTTL